jgi:PhnB protein
MKWNPHLTFDGRCREAFEYYEKCLGGKIVAMVGYADMPGAQDVPPELRGRVMHARLVLGDQVLMGCDAHPAMGTYEGIKACDVAVQVETPAEAERLFAALSEGGVVQMPLGDTFWSARFGMFTDQFGVPWMINCEKAPEA